MNGFNRNLALIIGINNYKNGIKSLSNAERDAVKLAEILEKDHDYDVTTILNQDATKPKLLHLLETTLGEYNLTKSDRLLFYFAGHGVTINSKNEQVGYIVPQDANLENLQHNNDDLISMATLYQHFELLECDHFLLILDCCFAGAFRWLTTRRVNYAVSNVTKAHYDRFINSRAWQIITSAANNQEAFDFIRDNRGTGKDGQYSPLL